MSKILLRRAEADDVGRLAPMADASFRETFLDGFAIPYPPQDLAQFLAKAYAPDVFARKLTDPRQATWVAERDGSALAYASAGPCDLPHAHARAEHSQLHRLYVLNAAQGQGLGRALLELALAWMGDTGPQWLSVWSGNLKAQRLYEAYGFQNVGHYQFFVGRWPDDDFIYRRDPPCRTPSRVAD